MTKNGKMSSTEEERLNHYTEVTESFSTLESLFKTLGTSEEIQTRNKTS